MNTLCASLVRAKSRGGLAPLFLRLCPSFFKGSPGPAPSNQAADAATKKGGPRKPDDLLADCLRSVGSEKNNGKQTSGPRTRSC